MEDPPYFQVIFTEDNEYDACLSKEMIESYKKKVSAGVGIECPECKKDESCCKGKHNFNRTCPTLIECFNELMSDDIPGEHCDLEITKRYHKIFKDHYEVYHPYRCKEKVKIDVGKYVKDQIDIIPDDATPEECKKSVTILKHLPEPEFEPDMATEEETDALWKAERTMPYFQMVINTHSEGKFQITKEFEKNFYARNRKYNLERCHQCSKRREFCKRCRKNRFKLYRDNPDFIKTFEEIRGGGPHSITDKFYKIWQPYASIPQKTGWEHVHFDKKQFIQDRIREVKPDTTPEKCQKILLSLKEENLPPIIYEQKKNFWDGQTHSTETVEDSDTE